MERLVGVKQSLR